MHLKSENVYLTEIKAGVPKEFVHDCRMCDSLHFIRLCKKC